MKRDTYFELTQLEFQHLEVIPLQNHSSCTDPQVERRHLRGREFVAR